MQNNSFLHLTFYIKYKTLSSKIFLKFPFNGHHKEKSAFTKVHTKSAIQNPKSLHPDTKTDYTIKKNTKTIVQGDTAG